MTRSQLAAAGALHTCQVERGKDKAWLGFRDSQYGHQNFPVYPRFGWIKQPFGAIQVTLLLVMFKGELVGTHFPKPNLLWVSSPG